MKQSDKTGDKGLFAYLFKMSRSNLAGTGHLHWRTILMLPNVICPVNNLRNVNSLVMYAFKGRNFIPCIVTIK